MFYAKIRKCFIGLILASSMLTAQAVTQEEAALSDAVYEKAFMLLSALYESIKWPEKEDRLTFKVIGLGGLMFKEISMDPLDKTVGVYMQEDEASKFDRRPVQCKSQMPGFQLLKCSFSDPRRFEDMQTAFGDKVDTHFSLLVHKPGSTPI